MGIRDADYTYGRLILRRLERSSTEEEENNIQALDYGAEGGQQEFIEGCRRIEDVGAMQPEVSHVDLLSEHVFRMFFSCLWG